MRALDVAGQDVGGEDVAGRRVLPPGRDNRQVLLGGGHEPRVSRIDLVELFEPARPDDPVEDLVGEQPLAPLLGAVPLVDERRLDPAERLLLGDARVGHAVHPALQERLLVGRREVAPVGEPLVVVVGDEVEQVLLQVRARARDDVDVVAPDHLGEREPELGRRHGAGEGDEHLAAAVDVGAVRLGGVDERGGVEVAVVVAEEVGDRAVGHGAGGAGWSGQCGRSPRDVDGTRAGPSP